MNQYPILISALLFTFSLVACSSGGTSGDTNADPDAVELITPFVGLYQLPTSWNGEPDSEGYLEIKEPNFAGESSALLYTVNTFSNCIDLSPVQGEVVKDPSRQDPNEQRVFMNRLPSISDSILTLSGTNLTIALSEDFNDVDNDSDNTDRDATLVATREFNQLSDLGNFCD